MKLNKIFLKLVFSNRLLTIIFLQNIIFTKHKLFLIDVLASMVFVIYSVCALDFVMYLHSSTFKNADTP